MYKLSLILRYLRRKLTPMFAALAVMLCTAMVIIVISIMGGFLNMMRASVHTLEGDVIIQGDATGFPYYREIMADIAKLPDVKGTTAMIRAYGLVSIPSGSRAIVRTVEVLGVDPSSLNDVVDYKSTLHWKQKDLLDTLDREVRPDDLKDPRIKQMYDKVRNDYQSVDPVAMGMTLHSGGKWGDKPGIVMGLHVSGFNLRDKKGQYDFFNNQTVGRSVTLTVPQISSRGAIVQSVDRAFTVVNEFKSGLYEIDANRVYVPFDELQKMLRIDAHPEIDNDTGDPTGRSIPGKCTTILVRGDGSVPPEVFRQRVLGLVQDFASKHEDFPPVRLFTWQERHAQFLGAVEKEKYLLTILFAFISLVAVAMIAVIFYMIVLEKTRDIGVLRAIGASRSGIAGIFLGYGLGIGVLGAFLGFWLAALIVWNINAIQDWLTYQFGLTIWSPEVYYFDKVPSQMNPREVTVILAVAVMSSIVGAIIPALLAARLNPVEALRYE